MFLSFVISLSESEYKSLHRQVTSRYEDGNVDMENAARNVFIAIPSKDMHLMLTGYETSRLYTMMEEADCEVKSLQLIAMFDA